VDRIKVGFIGCGSHSTENLYPCLRYFSDRVELVATCDIDAEKAERNARLFGFDKWYKDYRQMIEVEDLDGVFIVGHPNMHYEIGLECLKSGIHIFVEKPPALNSDQAYRLLEASKEHNRFVMVAFMKRFSVGYRLAKTIIDKLERGKIAHISTKFANGPYGSIWGIEPPAKAFLIGQAVHHFDLVRFLAGEVKEVYAKLHVLTDTKFSFSILLTFENGATGIMNLNSCQSWSKIDEYVEVTCDESFIFVDDMASQVKYYPKGLWIETDGFKAANQGYFWEINHLPTIEYQSRYLRGYYGEMEHFIDFILKNSPPKPDAEDGFKALKLAEAVWKSVCERSVVNVW
jgi:myo-inositol 2-dehydrogenase/D-chiro-inositol 1-dehydrogenase